MISGAHTAPFDEGGNLSELKMGFDAFLWAAAMIAFPFYLAGKGQAQLSSLILCVLFIICGAREYNGTARYVQGSKTVLVMMGLFVFYSILVNFTWVVILSDPKPAMTPVYYLFDFLVLWALISMYGRYGLKFIHLTRWALLVSVTMQFALSFWFANLGFRERLFFNNANQLGYFALVCASVFALPVPSKPGIKGILPWMTGLLMCLWLAILSLSKSAVLSCMIFLVLGSVRKPTQILLGAIMAVVVLTATWDHISHRVDNLGTRLGTLGKDSDDSLEGRGYDRIWENPEMLILGAGETANYRWQSFSKKGELHSTPGTILFSYGIPGCILALAFFFSVLRPAFLVMLPYALPELAYSLTHMSLRFVMTWVYFGMMFAVAYELYKIRVTKFNQRRLSFQKSMHV